MAPLLSLLASQGLSLLTSAIQAKGKEVIESKLGVSLDTAVQTPEGILKLKDASELGTAGSKYVLIGWVCTSQGDPGTWRSAF